MFMFVVWISEIKKGLATPARPFLYDV